MHMSRRSLMAAGAAVAACSMIQTAPAMGQSADEAAVAKAVEALRTAMLAADKDKLLELVSDQLSYGHSAGKLETKAQFVDVIVSKKTIYKTLTFADQSIAVAGNTAIVRNGAKIASVRHNARFIQDVAQEHGGFGKMLSTWPTTREVELLTLLTKRGNRLGGNTGQMTLRFLGWDGFMLSRDVVACLRDAGLDLAPEPKSQRDLDKIQAQFNAWAEETGLSFTHLSRICAMSVGENYTTEQLQRMGGGDDGA